MCVDIFICIKVGSMVFLIFGFHLQVVCSFIRVFIVVAWVNYQQVVFRASLIDWVEENSFTQQRWRIIWLRWFFQYSTGKQISHCGKMVWWMSWCCKYLAWLWELCLKPGSVEVKTIWFWVSKAKLFTNNITSHRIKNERNVSTWEIPCNWSWAVPLGYVIFLLISIIILEFLFTYVSFWICTSSCSFS